MIYLRKVAPAIEFYKKAFDAIELRRWSNDDGSVHVAELMIDGTLFYLHEEVTRKNELSPEILKGTNIAIGLFVNDPYTVVAKAAAAGGTEMDPVADYDYQYRQGYLADPFGHHWLIEKKLDYHFVIQQVIFFLPTFYLLTSPHFMRPIYQLMNEAIYSGLPVSFLYSQKNRQP